MIKKIFDKNFILIDIAEYYRKRNIDLKINADFRGRIELDLETLKSRELKYLKFYRLAQVARETIWFKIIFRRLKNYGYKTGIRLDENLNIGDGLIIGHSGTIIINGSAVLGNEIMLTHGVTIGRDVRGKRKGSPVIGNKVCIRTNSTVVGKISIGDDVLIAPNTFVNFDVPSHSIVIGNPATIHHRDNATEGHLYSLKETSYENSTIN